MKRVVTIIGSGMMGSALAFPAMANGHEVRLVGTPLDRDIIDACKVAAQDQQIPVALLQQVFRSDSGAVVVICRDAGEIFKAQFPGAAGNQNRRNGNCRKLPAEVHLVAAQKDDTQRFLLPAKGNGPVDLIAQLIDIVENHRMAGLGKDLLVLSHHGGEQLVSPAFDHNEDTVAVILLQIAGIGIDFKSLGLHHCHNSLASLFADIGMPVEHTGNRSQRIPGFPGQIFDGHN